jgi:hypothetical protein
MIADKVLYEGTSEMLCILIGKLSISAQGPVSALVGNTGTNVGVMDS